MPGQAQNLVNKLRADSSINMEQDWKMITLFIGGNNLCAFCNDLVSFLLGKSETTSTWISCSCLDKRCSVNKANKARQARLTEAAFILAPRELP